MDMRDKYWIKLNQYKFELFYYKLYLEKNKRKERFYSTISLVISVFALGGWVLLNSHDKVFALVILGVQIFSVIQANLPYKGLIKEIDSLYTELSVLYNEMESNWHYIDTEQKNENEINDLLYNFINNWERVSNEYFCEANLPVDKKISKDADKEKQNYFNINFGVTNDD